MYVHVRSTERFYFFVRVLAVVLRKDATQLRAEEVSDSVSFQIVIILIEVCRGFPQYARK
jgi:hypothetical protein